MPMTSTLLMLHSTMQSIAHSVELIISVYNNSMYSRFIRLPSTTLSHPSSFIRSVFHVSSLACHGTTVCMATPIVDHIRLFG